MTNSACFTWWCLTCFLVIQLADNASPRYTQRHLLNDDDDQIVFAKSSVNTDIGDGTQSEENGFKNVIHVLGVSCPQGLFKTVGGVCRKAAAN